jgi:selenocysteine-specific elongation factor
VERHVVIGTAGHVDHGKTALVKALTGVDTDRWEEEKRRGITIDLGFAPLDLGEGLKASVVDVPGHEDFVRNMVAGATGVDVALLVVAADEGVMPQTVEHSAILDLLDVRAGAVAITKADLAEPEWLELVTADVKERLARSPLRWEAPVPVSAITGSGLDALREALRRAAVRARERAADDLFRLPVDRVFSLAGAGTVVTGTTWSGTVAVGQEVMVHPGPVRARVRSVEVHGHAEQRAEPGRRTALALVGLDRAAASRGSVVVSDASWRPTSELDVLVTLLADTHPLTQRSRLRLHLGTAEVLARVVPAAERLEPGAEGQVARLRLEEPIIARWGDRAVLRSASPVTTIGGCRVVDPFPASRPRRPRSLAERAGSDPVQRVRAFVEAEGQRGLAMGDLAVRLGVAPGEIPGVVLRAVGDGLVQAGGRLVPQAAAEQARALVLDRLASYHREHPMLQGLLLEAFRQLIGEPALAAQVLEALTSEGVVVQEGGGVRLAEHRPAIPPELSGRAAALRTDLTAAGAEGRSTAELAARHAGIPVADVAEFLVREGTAIRIGKDRYYDRTALESAARSILVELKARGRIAPSEVRIILGLTRKHIIPILEWMDARGLTVRVGDTRRLGAAAHQQPWETLDGFAGQS